MLIVVKNLPNIFMNRLTGELYFKDRKLHTFVTRSGYQATIVPVLGATGIYMVRIVRRERESLDPKYVE